MLNKEFFHVHFLWSLLPGPYSQWKWNIKVCDFSNGIIKYFWIFSWIFLSIMVRVILLLLIKKWNTVVTIIIPKPYPEKDFESLDSFKCGVVYLTIHHYFWGILLRNTWMLPCEYKPVLMPSSFRSNHIVCSFELLQNYFNDFSVKQGPSQ